MLKTFYSSSGGNSAGMLKLDEKDIRILDYIIDQVLVKRYVTTEDFKKMGLIDEHKNKDFVVDIGYNPEQEFLRYLSFLRDYEICKCFFQENLVYAEKNENTLRFQREGGFKEFYKTLEKDERNRKLEVTLAESNIESNELTKKNFKFNKNMAYFNAALGIFNVGFLLWQLLSR